jgi:hypothetical protein
MTNPPSDSLTQPKGPMSGYHDCPCTTCFEVAIGEEPDGSPSLCNLCAEASCDGEGDCAVPIDE